MFHDVVESGFWVIPKITSANLCTPIRDIINYFTSICPFESGKCGKCGKEEEKLQISREKFEYLENEKSFLDEIKNHFHIFWMAVVW